MAEACDGFSVFPDIAYDGVADFVELVVPILQDRSLFHREYGSSLPIRKSKIKNNNNFLLPDQRRKITFRIGRNENEIWNYRCRTHRVEYRKKIN
ncbi:hypothetical protein D1872_220580 [compost metagenome]